MTLTPREQQVGALLAKPYKLIAYELGISVRTVEVHVEHILEKLGASTRTEAALMLARRDAP